MAKRIIACFLGAVLAFPLSLAATAATSGGFFQQGGYTDTTPSFTFLTERAVQVYNKELIEDPDYDEIYTGSSIYIPIGIVDETTDNESIAQAKAVKDNNIEINYKITRGAQYINNVSIVDGKKDKIKGLDAGNYVKVETSNGYTGLSYADIDMMIVLSVNKVSYQNTRIELVFDLANRLEYIDDDSVYGAQVPTRFEVDDRYNGDATFDMGNGIKYTARVKAKAKYTLDFNQDPNYDIDNMYSDAYIQFYNFLGKNDAFSSVGKLQISVDTKKFSDKDTGQPRVYAYEILPDQQLLALGSDVASYDSKKNVLTIRAQSLGSYVLSNQKLQQEVQEEDSQVLQSGYLTKEEIAASEAAAQSSSQSGSSKPASSQSVSSLSASSQATSAPAPTVNQNVNTGGDIYADNPSGGNPLTGSGANPASIALTGLGVAASLLLCAHKKH